MPGSSEAEERSRNMRVILEIEIIFLKATRWHKGLRD